MFAELCCGHLVGGNGVGNGLARRAVVIRPRQPVGASPVCLSTELMLAALDNREVFLVTSQRLQPLRLQFIG